jgi:hypothetical protein
MKRSPGDSNKPSSCNADMQGSLSAYDNNAFFSARFSFLIIFSKRPCLFQGAAPFQSAGGIPKSSPAGAFS